MDGERLFKIVMMDLNSDILKLEDELESTINSNLGVNEKTKKIKKLLSQMVMVESSIVKFTSMFSIDNNNNNILNNEQNGQF
jgi:hypothetical protein